MGAAGIQTVENPTSSGIKKLPSSRNASSVRIDKVENGISTHFVS
jgi:hypothetical protein